jgi:hypothetical protein
MSHPYLDDAARGRRILVTIASLSCATNLVRPSSRLFAGGTAGAQRPRNHDEEYSMNKQPTTTSATPHVAHPPGHPLKEGAAYDKRELRERVADEQAILEKELERLQAIEPAPTSHPQLDTIAAALAALKVILPADGATISEVSAAELSRWIEAAPFVGDEKTRHERRERK